jgi:3',5'-cyclic AMP phosphodiesterase CpdA
VRQRIALLLFVLAPFALARTSAQDGTLTGGADAVRFAVIGDSGTGDSAQYEVGRQMSSAHEKFPFDFVLMLGDNLYGRQRPEDFVSKFERPYAALLENGVRFIASLGNHDNPANRNYKGFNMDGQRYFSYARKNARFFVLDSNSLDSGQISWLENELKSSREDWKLCLFHHPLYSNAGRHGSDVSLRVILEPLFVKYGVDVVFSGHDHVYERFKPQKGITYFVEGASGELANGDVNPKPTTAAYFDRDRSFILVQIDHDQMSFQAISRTGEQVDAGVVTRRPQC